MKQLQIRLTRGDVLWNYAGTLFSMINNFILLPFLVAYLSGAELGLWYVYIAIGNLVMLFELGFNPTFARNFAFCWSGASELTREGCVRSSSDNVNPRLLSTLLGACRMVYRRIALVASIVLLIPGTLYILFVAGELNVVEVIASWLIYALGVLLNLYFLYYGAVLRGIGLIAADNKIRIISRLLQFAFTVVLLVSGFGLVGATLGFLSYALIYRMLSYRAFWHSEEIAALQLKTIKVNRGEIKHLYQTISYNAYKDGSVQIANYVATQASSLVCSSFLGLEEAGAYSIALQFATAIGNMSLALMNSSRPMLQSAYQRGDVACVNRTLSRCVAVYIVLYWVMYACVLLFAYPFLNLFRPESSFDPAVFSGLSVYVFLFDWCALFSSMLCNMNTIPYAKSYVISSAFGIALSCALVVLTSLGSWGLILGMTASQVLYNVWKWPLYTARQLDTKVRLLALQGFSDICKSIRHKGKGNNVTQ